MKLNSKTNLGAICVVLTLAATQASALTLGRARGGALLGKQLDVTVLVQFAADEDIKSACFTADVSYGDSPLERSRITVQSQVGPQPNSQLVRVTASARVDEPVVTVNLMSACAPKASRRYVLLADVVSELGASAPLVDSPTAVASASARQDVPLVAPPAPLAAGAVETKKPVRPPVPAAKSTVSRDASKVAVTGSAASEAAIKAAKQVNAEALAALQQRVDEIGKWQAGSNVAEELLKSQAREKILESDIQGLHVVTAKNQQHLQTVAAELERSESYNYGGVLVYALGALLAAFLSAIAYLYILMRRASPNASPWWSGSGERPLVAAQRQEVAKNQATSGSEFSPVAIPAEAVLPQKPAADAQGLVAAAPTLLDEEWSSSSLFPVAPTTVPMPVEAVGADAVVPILQGGNVGLKTINTREMLDVRQQAEFFMALGQHDDAVKLLETNIQSSEDANPLIYLDLLKIFHTLSRRADFERVRTEFNLQFTGRIPEYSSFLIEGNGLDAYDDICQQIVVLWPTDYTVDFIEQCLVRTPEDDPEQGIDLEAFKDLLLLYGVLKRLDQTVDSVVLPFSASRTANSLTQTSGAGTGAATQTNIDIAPPLPTIAAVADREPVAGLDLDLDLDLDLNLDIGNEPDKPVEADNLINFDMSGYELPPEAKLPKK